jgi:hypothetical protein
MIGASDVSIASMAHIYGLLTSDSTVHCVHGVHGVQLRELQRLALRVIARGCNGRGVSGPDRR